MRIFTWIFGGVFAVLAACGGAGDVIDGAGGGGSGGGGSGGGSSGDGPGSLVCALTGCEIAKLAPTSTMPTGNATYAGKASITTTEANGALRTTNADLSMSANFASGNLGVNMTNVQTGSVNYLGSLTGSGTISGNQFTSNYSGVLVDTAVGATLMSGTMEGTFRGTNAAALNGTMTLLGGGGTGGDAFGQFWANRQ